MTQLLLAFLLLGAVAVSALPSGAPAGACSNLTPSPSGHGSAIQAEMDLPYAVNLSTLPMFDGVGYGYEPGATYRCELH